MQEEFRKIEGFDDYEISNYGRVKSKKNKKEKILKNNNDAHGYYHVNLYDKNNKQSTKKIHKLVAISFLNHNPCGHKLVVNHKDFNRKNNHIDNLEIITQRENTNKKHLKNTSKYIGVVWNKKCSKWFSRIVINGKRKHLGVFKSELEAHIAYENALNNL